MNLDRDRSENSAKTAIVFKKVHSRFGALNSVLSRQRMSVGSERNASMNEPVLTQVEKVGIDLFLRLSVGQIEIKAVRCREWVCRRCRLKNPLLKRSIQFHLSGLRGLFEWKQKANTDAPDTYSA